METGTVFTHPLTREEINRLKSAINDLIRRRELKRGRAVDPGGASEARKRAWANYDAKRRESHEKAKARKRRYYANNAERLRKAYHDRKNKGDA